MTKKLGQQQTLIIEHDQKFDYKPYRVNMTTILFNLTIWHLNDYTIENPD